VPFTSLVAEGIDLYGVSLTEEVTLYPQVYVGAEASIAPSAVALVGAMIGHGVSLGEGAIVAPKAVINARVQVGAGAYIGSNASILPDLVIGDGATVAANTVVVSDVPAGATAIGVPANIMLPHAAQGVRPAAASRPRTADVDPNLAEVIGGEMKSLLGIDSVPLQANFFDIGGTSLKALQLSQILRDRHGLAIQLIDLYQYPSLQALVEAFSGGDETDAPVQQAQQRAALRRQRMRR
jgi:acyl carrier protein